MSKRELRGCLLGVSMLAAACAPGGDDPAQQAPDFTSKVATLLSFEFDGEVEAPATSNPKKFVRDQLFYTVGMLNAYKSVGRLDRLEITAVKKTSISGGVRIRYHASMPVAWGSKTDLPSTFEFTLPKRVSEAGLKELSDKYSKTCVADQLHVVSPGNFWFHWRPMAEGCSIDPDDVVKLTARVTVSEENTTDKYPEYHKVWADNTLRVVAIFGKFQDGATDSKDVGIRAYNAFVEAFRKRSLRTPPLTSTPAEIPKDPGVAVPDVTFEGTSPAGHHVSITALLIDSPRSAGKAFDARYADLSQDADLIFYNGHAGLGANIRALAEKGKFTKGQYQIFFMNGCDTFAYLDDRLAERRKAVNPDDPSGTKYMDILTNVMPAYFNEMPTAALALINGLLSVSAPRTYEEIFEKVAARQVVVGTGEEDNVFDPASPPPWPGYLTTADVLASEMHRYETPVLAPGKYSVSITAKTKQSGGDADLYVRLGAPPTIAEYDHVSYSDGSDEQIEITLDEPTRLYFMVLGHAPKSSYVFTAKTLE